MFVNGNSIVVQSGGPTAVINSSLIGLVDTILESNYTGKIYGAIGGIHGLMNKKVMDLKTLNQKERFTLRYRPGAVLGTCRHKLTTEDIILILDNLKKLNVRYFFYIGGNGSMEVARLINETSKSIGFNLIVIGIPTSIDNDLMETDHSPGYGSAAKFLATSVLDMKFDVESYQSTNRVTIIETMGRHTGWLAASCSLAIDKEDEKNQLLIYIPEVTFSLNDCLNKIEKATKQNKNTFLIVAEGIKDQAGCYIEKQETMEYDVLNRARLGGVSIYLKDEIETHTGLITRAINPSIWQRSSILLASKTDIEEAYEVGRNAWEIAHSGYSGVMVGMDRESRARNDYHIVYRPKNLELVSSFERSVPLSWYDEEENNMTQEFTDYISPLLQGDLFLPTKNGLPDFGTSKKMITVC